MNQQKKKKLSLFSWLNKGNKQTDLRGQYNFILFYFMFGGPCHISIFKQCSGDLIFLWELLFLFSYVEKKPTYLSLYLYLKLQVWSSSPKLHSAPLRFGIMNQVGAFIFLLFCQFYITFLFGPPQCQEATYPLFPAQSFLQQPVHQCVVLEQPLHPQPQSQPSPQPQPEPE